MDVARPIQFRIAADASEFEQIFQLGYETFVDEIPQHRPNALGRHVDRFHDENTYVIAVEDERVVGMVALRGERPFSLDQKLGSVDAYLPADRRTCELRLLAVRPTHRRGRVFRGLVELILRHGRAEGYDLAIISGAVRQEKLYRHLGFTPFGPRVGTDAAPFQPMYITLERFQARAPSLNVGKREVLSFLPGPVMLSKEVRSELARSPVSHRSRAFDELASRARGRLCRLVRAPRVTVLLGSGTLANEAVAGQLALRDEPGLVLSNGEFGDRLIDHASRWDLRHVAVRSAWGCAFDLDRVERTLTETGARWMWAVASETSTGMLNDVEALKALATRFDLALCLDAISAVGAVPLDLTGVALATGASGKALASFAGLSFVYHGDDVRPAAGRLPRYVDLGSYAEAGGTPFTHSSNLIGALDVALERFGSPDPYGQLERNAAHLRTGLAALGLPVLVAGPAASPAVVTVPLPPAADAVAVGDDLAEIGLHVACRSEYLVRRNWMQIGVMGCCTEAHIDRLLPALKAIVGDRASSASQSAVN